MTATEGAGTARVHAAYHYDRYMRLRVPLQLWLGFALGLAHVLSYWPVIGFLLGPLANLLADWRLFVCDALNVLVMVVAGFRTPAAGPRMRWLWRRGRGLLLCAHGLALLGFAVLHAQDVRWHEAAEVLPVLAMVAGHVAMLLYLWRSVLVRDVFADFPQPEDGQPEKVPPLPVVQRQRQAQALQAQCVSALVLVPEGAAARGYQLLQGLSAAGHDAALWHALGMFWLSHAQEPLALECVRLACDFDGGQALFQQNLGELERRSGHLEAALRHGQAAVRLAPNDPNAHYNLAVALAQAGLLDAALSTYEKVVALQPAHAAAWNNLGVLWQSRGDAARARNAYEQALRADPGHEQSRVNLTLLPPAA